MAKRKLSHKVVNHGMYGGWDRDSKELPTLEKSNDTIPARLEVEFGYILNIKNAKGKVLEFRIEHPPFTDDAGEIALPFVGELYVRTNDWDFFLGDKVWEPVEDKIGDWRLITKIENEILEDRTFSIVAEGWDSDWDF